MYCRPLELSFGWRNLWLSLRLKLSFDQVDFFFMTRKQFSRSLFLALMLALPFGLSACGSGSVVSDSNSPAGQPAAQPATAQSPGGTAQTGAAQPANAQPAAQAQQPTPSPTLHPLMKEAQSKPGVPVSVPESMKRPLNAEEMKKALQAMPPEVRARIQGMQAAPQGVVPQPTKKP